MKRVVVLFLVSALGATTALADEAAAEAAAERFKEVTTDLAARVAASREIVKTFAGELKAELQAAMQAGGAVNAIGVCKVKAPEIAAKLSAAKGWTVGRTSLKVRNPANAPDTWERAGLESFARHQELGESVKKMEYYQPVEQGGKWVFRYLKTIPTGKLCLACHGTNLTPAVKAKLDELYPHDQARGFKLGDIRGAFTIKQPMPPPPPPLPVK